MKKKISIAILMTACFFITVGKIDEEKLDLKKVEKSNVKISDNIYACKFETANYEYREFENELKAKSRMEEYKIAVVDSQEWQKKFPYAHHEPLVNMYGCHPAYDHYPVVNISYEGADMFCAWLTEKYNAWQGRGFKKVKFRLPTREEWELAARGGKYLENYPFGNYLRDKDGKYLCNYRTMGDEYISSDIDARKFSVVNDQSVHAERFIADAMMYTAPVHAYWPNGFGIYNMSGNVAEMVNEKGTACGGSWCDTGYDVRIESKMNYDKPSPLVGFRYFMEVLEK